ncbi:MAG: alpha-ketoglutarate-dependent dioxygenase AlkB [Rhodospirillaceae bacterium]
MPADGGLGRSPERLALADGEVTLHRNVFGDARAAALFRALRHDCAWRQADIRLFGRTVRQPRLTAWYGTRDYTYSGLTWPAQAWPPAFDDIRHVAEAAAGCAFNGVLANLYRNGRDSMGWHSDDEPELGPTPAITSVSLGAARRFVLRRRDDRSVKIELELPGDSLLVMQGTTQAHWQHAVPKTARPVGPRINLTFRNILA